MTAVYYSQVCHFVCVGGQSSHFEWCQLHLDVCSGPDHSRVDGNLALERAVGHGPFRAPVQGTVHSRPGPGLDRGTGEGKGSGGQPLVGRRAESTAAPGY